MIRRLLFRFLGFLGFVLVLFAAWQALTTPTRVSSNAIHSELYESIVNDIFIKRGWLVTEKTESGSVKVRFDYSRIQESSLSQAARAYAVKSHLEKDVVRFNRGATSTDRAIFRIRHGQLLSLDRYVHRNQTVAAQAPGKWIGWLKTRPTQVDGTHLVLYDPSSNADRSDESTVSLFPQQGYVTSERARDFRLFERKGGVVSGEIVSLTNRDNQVAARLRLMGDSVIVDVENPRRTIARLNGLRLRPDRLTAFRRGDVLQFVEIPAGRSTGQTPEQRVIAFGDRQTDIVYRASPYGGIWNQSTESPFYQALVDRLGRAANARPGIKQQDIVLTIDHQLESEIQAILRKQAARQRVSNPGTKPITYPAAITILDAENGDILAMASYAGDPAATAAIGLSQQQARQTNWNLRKIEIGSVAKVLFAAAVLKSQPELRNLQIGPYKPPIESILGVEFAKPVDDHPFGGYVNFETFIQESSNKYALTLMGLAASDPRRASAAAPKKLEKRDQYWIGPATEKVTVKAKRKKGTKKGKGRASKTIIRELPAIRERPTGFAFADDNNDPTIFALPWAGSMSRLFDVCVDNARGDCPPTRAESVWRNLTGPLIPNVKQLNASLGRVSVAPAMENLQLDLIRDFRADYAPLILGSGNSVWSPVKVAEAFAQVVTGVRVEARMVAGSRPADYPGIELDEPVRQAILAGMARVPIDGTARRLTRVIRELQKMASAQGKLVTVHAKTGTPAIHTARPSARAQVINQEWSQSRQGQPRRLTVGENGLLYFDGSLLTADWMEINARNFSRIQRRALTVIQQFNEAEKDLRYRYLQVRGNTVYDDSKIADSDKPTGHVFAFVVSVCSKRTDDTCDRSKPSRTLSVVAAFKRRAGTTKPGLIVADQLLRGPLPVALGLASRN